MSQDNLVKMECTKCKTIGHRTKKNKKKIKERLTLNKHCKQCGTHTEHRETK